MYVFRKEIILRYLKHRKNILKCVKKILENPAQIRLKISRTGPEPDVRSGRTGPDMSGIRLIPTVVVNFFGILVNY